MSALSVTDQGERTRPTGFVVCGLPRSGTTLVCAALLEHPQVLIYGELFHDLPRLRRNEAARRTLGAGWEIQTPAHSALRACADDEDGGAYLERFYSLRGPMRALGFKLLLDQAREAPHDTVWQYLAAQESVRVVHVIRDNLLEMACSWTRARRTRRWHSQRPLEPGVAFELPAAECAQLFERFTREPLDMSALRGAGRVLEIGYHELCARFAASMDRLCRFLDIDVDIVTMPALHKIAQLPPARELTNYAALKQHFRHTPYARYFVD